MPYSDTEIDEFLAAKDASIALLAGETKAFVEGYGNSNTNLW